MSRKLAIPCYSVKGLKLPKGMEVIYVGWALAGKVVGLSKIRKDYSVKAVVQVGMSPVYPSSVETCARQNDLAGVKVFVKQGRFDIDRLPLPFKLIMKVKCKEIASRLAAKGNLTEAEQATLKMAQTATKAGGINIIKDLFGGKTPVESSPVTQLAGNLFNTNVLKKLGLGAVLGTALTKLIPNILGGVTKVFKDQNGDGKVDMNDILIALGGSGLGKGIVSSVLGGLFGRK